MMVVVVLVAVSLVVAVVVVGFLLLVVGCADVLMCCDARFVALWRGLFMCFSWNQNHDLAAQLPIFLWRKQRRKKHDFGPLMRVPNDAHWQVLVAALLIQ